MEPSNVVSRNEWLDARMALLADEKKLTALKDQLAAKRRTLPWVRVEEPYVFTGPDGEETLLDLFGPHSQLIVYHFMFGPGWEQGCKSCSLLSDHIDATRPHLAARDVGFAVVSRAPLDEFAPFKERLGWTFKWVSSSANSFNFDYHVSFAEADIGNDKNTYNFDTIPAMSEEMPGASVFIRNDKGEIFHTYSCYARGLDGLIGTYSFLDLVPKGRDEDDLDFTMAWVRYHDSYDS
ncbi:MAG: thioredoxin family protein [Pseudomonadota bacterium]